MLYFIVYHDNILKCPFCLSVMTKRVFTAIPCFKEGMDACGHVINV